MPRRKSHTFNVKRGRGFWSDVGNTFKKIGSTALDLAPHLIPLAISALGRKQNVHKINRRNRKISNRHLYNHHKKNFDFKRKYKHILSGKGKNKLLIATGQSDNYSGPLA